MDPDVVGVHLKRTQENGAEIDALAGLLGGRVGLRGVLADLNRRGRRVWTRPFWPPGRAVHRALTWDRADRRTPQWWPQGVSSSAEASGAERIEGRRLLAVTWYAKDLGEGGHGSRVTFLDLDDRRYRHVLLAVPRLGPDGSPEVRPVRVHAGGLAWCGGHLHVAATYGGFVTFRLDDLVRVPDEGLLTTYGYRYLLPARFTHESLAAEGHERLRFSFLSLDRAASPPQLVAGEYAVAGRGSHRLAHFPLDPESLLPQVGDDGISWPLALENRGVPHTQGVAVAGSDYYLTVSRGRSRAGTVYAGRPGAFRRFPYATPMGPEDLSWWPSTDELWSVSEHPGRRWVFSMERSWFAE